MELTRRQFASSLAAVASLFSLRAAPQSQPSIVDTLPGIGRLRHIHMEIGPGPWPRTELRRVILSVMQPLGLDAPHSLTSLGANVADLVYPQDFVFTLAHDCGALLVIRASHKHRSPREVTLRGELGSAVLQLQD